MSPIDRFATASAVNAAFRQVGAVLGTALLVAIVGEPIGLREALSSADAAYLFAAIAGVASGVVTLALRPSEGGEPSPDVNALADPLASG